MMSVAPVGAFRGRALPGALPYVALASLGLIVFVGTLWAFQRGAGDFRVFYTAWDLAMHGRGLDIYRVGPDRYLYAPGFAWLLGPLSYLPYEAALALWCFAKAAVIGYVLREFSLRLRDSVRIDELSSFGASALGVLLLSRPLLIDFQYGQVNTFILGACAWALLGHFDREAPSWKDALRWAVLAVAALAKIFPLPLLLLPWTVTAAIPARRLAFERAGALAGLVALLGLPALSFGASGVRELLAGWREALLAKGLPLDSHNQSFGAFVSHYFSGKPVHFISLGPEPVPFGLGAWLSDSTIHLLTLGWMAILFGVILALLLSGSSKAPLRLSALLIALLILPSHLVWKPYFVMCIPLAILAVHRTLRELAAGEPHAGRGAWMAAALAFAFAGINLSGFDLVGHRVAGWLEAGAVFLWMELLILAIVVWPRSEDSP